MSGAPNKYETQVKAYDVYLETLASPAGMGE
jgi:hypothetical protein